jgi:DNA-binding NarL/FixJ family response regulator
MSVSFFLNAGVDGMKILFIDASPFGQNQLRDLLSDVQNIEIAGSVQDAISAYETIDAVKPDLIILDIEMPDRNGIELLQKIKCLFPSITVIVLTNLSYPQYRVRCLEIGAEFFFDKSTEFLKVTQAVQLLVQNEN